MVGPGRPIRPFWVRWRRGGGDEQRGWMVKLLNWTAAGFYFLSRLFSAITSIMAMQRAKQASSHGLYSLV